MSLAWSFGFRHLIIRIILPNKVARECLHQQIMCQCVIRGLAGGRVSSRARRLDNDTLASAHGDVIHLAGKLRTCARSIDLQKLAGRSGASAENAPRSAQKSFTRAVECAVMTNGPN